MEMAQVTALAMVAMDPAMALVTAARLVPVRI
jgi:hypothetical protein